MRTHSKRTTRHPLSSLALWLGVLTLPILVGLLAAAPRALADDQAAEVMPSVLAAEAAQCAECHEETVKPFASSAHGRAWSHSGKYSASSCSSCHGDTAKHLESNDPADIVVPDKLSAADSNELCLECHNDSETQAHWMGSAHQKRGVGCVDCHDVHAEPAADSMVNAKFKTDSCLNCHKDVKAQLWKTSHHPVREGKMTCTSCHNPHGSLTKANLNAASANELCYECHTEKRGPFLWEHAPVRENCMSCHAPHGSNHLKLQTTSVPYICQQCHLNTRHPGTVYDGTTLAGASRASNRIFNRACLDCHAAIHGSNHPSSPYLGY